MDISSAEHYKVYYRFEDDAIASYYIRFVGIFYFYKKYIFLYFLH